MNVCLTFDFDAESVQVRQEEEQGRVSKGQFAVKRGIPRILTLLKKYSIKATFFTCGWVAEEYPVLVKEIVKNGHELGAHGYLHEYFDKLSVEQEKNVIEKMTKPLLEFTDQIKGFRAPYWHLSPVTLKLVAEAGYVYDSSLFSDDRPYYIPSSNLLEFPVEWFLDDWVIFEIHQHSPTSAFDIWKSQFDSFSEIDDIPTNRRVFTLTCHPAAIGHTYRLNVLEKLINHMKVQNVTFQRMGDVAAQIIDE
ncbi:MAG: polysaccharide deacetylase family protein [Candidatus Hodarchaeales archaeon]